jgi:hypothetical protein
MTPERDVDAGAPADVERPAPADVRTLVPLWRLRQLRHAVVVCGAAPEWLAETRAAIEELGAEVVVEEGSGPLGDALGRPSVTVASRFGQIGWRGPAATPERVLAELETFELACPECGPQAWGDPGA